MTMVSRRQILWGTADVAAVGAAGVSGARWMGFLRFLPDSEMIMQEFEAGKTRRVQGVLMSESEYQWLKERDLLDAKPEEIARLLL